MIEGESLPSGVAEAVELLVDSLDSLQVVILLASEQDRSWSAELVAERLHLPPGVARKALRHAHARGLAAIGPGAAGYRFAPVDGARARAAARLLDFYGSRRIELINHVAARALGRMRIPR